MNRRARGPSTLPSSTRGMGSVFLMQASKTAMSGKLLRSHSHSTASTQTDPSPRRAHRTSPGIALDYWRTPPPAPQHRKSVARDWNRTSNLLVVRGPKKSHEDLLSKARYIGDVAGPMAQKPLQAPAVFSGDACDESMFVERAQPPSPE